MREQAMARDNEMLDVLIPIDGSQSAERAVQFIIGLHRKLAPLQVRLLNVQLPKLTAEQLHATVGGSGDPAAEAQQAMREAESLLAAANVPYISETRSGHIPHVIAQYARQSGCSGVVMGTRGMGTTDQVLGSIARQVISLVDVPITLVK
jgi:nucleotide-binding universal stress UspA family protein